MVREMAVRLEVTAARRIRAEASEDLRHEEAAVAVARVNDDMHALERRVLLAERLADLLAQEMAVAVHEIVLLHLGEIALHLGMMAGAL